MSQGFTLFWLGLFLSFLPLRPCRAAEIRRGDSNADGAIDISDAVYVLSYLFGGGPPPACMDAADANADGGVGLSDAVSILKFLFGSYSYVPGPQVEDSPTRCTEPPGLLPVPFDRIALPCIDMVSPGFRLGVVARTQEEYDRLIYEKFERRLEEYWEKNYPSVKESLRRRHPDISDDELEDLVREYFYSTYPFRGTEDCTLPEIDFSQYSLIGQGTTAGGCEEPGYGIEVFRDDEAKEYTFRITIFVYGFCMSGINSNHWVLVPRIPPSYEVAFEEIELISWSRMWGRRRK